MELKDLVGKRKLSGVDTFTIEVKVEANVVRFVIDGKTYKAIEDPSDGYRSYLSELEVTEERITNEFPPQEVFGKMKDNEDYAVNDTIQFIDTTTNKIVLEIGTDNTDDDYPYCVLIWSPENMAINIGR